MLIVWIGAFLVTAPHVGSGLWLDYVLAPLTAALALLVVRYPGVVEGWVGLVARLAVGGIWIWAGLLKLPDPAGSMEAVRAYELLPQSLVEPVGYLLPVLEVVLGLALVLGLMARGAALLSTALLVVFVVGIASAWARGLQIDCGCFGDGGVNANASRQYPWEIVRDVALVAASLFVLTVRQSRLALDSALFRNRLSLDDFLEADEPADQPEGSTR